MNRIPKVVGVGASAGGLEAINAFFDQITNDTGLAFVVIQHLSIDFKSLMDELLSKHTEMPISVVDKDMPVEPNHIYLISSATNIILKDGMIKQVERSEGTKLNLPIDLFFHSLGDQQGADSIGVILSGTGTDGSRGLKTIKEAGGLVYVQDPDTAQFDGMPKAAIHLADNVLSPSAIAEEIVAITVRINTGIGLSINIELEDHQRLFNKILDRIEEVTGAKFKDYRSKTLVRRLEKRMYLNHFADLREYYIYLTKNNEETQLLFKECLIGVTQFFRDTEAFEVFNNQVIPNLFGNIKEGESLRIWVPGCSTGAEAYSLAMLIMEYQRMFNKHQSLPFKIFASDIDPDAIKTAVVGSFLPEIVGDVPPLYLERYFDKKGNLYVVSKELREKIVFTVHNALQDPPFINIDLISCRNMIIYLNLKAQESLMTNFLFSLKLDGVLFLGPSESLNSAKDYYTVINGKWNFYRKAVDERPVPVSNYQSRKIKNNLRNVTTKSSQRYVQDLTMKQNDVFARMLSSLHAPKSVFVNKELDIIYINGDMSNILRFPSAFAQLNLLTLVDESIEWVFNNGVRESFESDKTIRYNDIQFHKDEKSLLLNTTFKKIKFRELNNEFILITFEISGKKENETPVEKIVEIDQFKDEYLKSMEYELREIKKEKQDLVEQLGTTNEELQSSNEELLASNEELQSTNEELQSVNEELYTVNIELQTKIKELVVSNNDISNLLQSTQIGTIFLDERLHIRKFTPALKKQFSLQESDIGRPITHFTNSLNDSKIYKEIMIVLNEAKPIEREIVDQKGCFYLMRILPYKTDTGVIDGVVITFININEIKNSFLEQETIAEQYKVLFENSQDLISIIDEKGNIQTSNVDFFAGMERRDLIGTNLVNLASPEFRNAAKKSLQKLKENLEPQQFDSKWVFPNKKESWFYNLLNPVVVDGEIKSITWVSRDVTKSKSKEHKLMERSRELETQVKTQSKVLSSKNIELEEINAYLDAFVHGAAHDLRSPISRMKGMIDLLPDISTTEQKDQVFKSIQEGILSLDSTLSGLIEMVEFQKHTEKLISEIDLKLLYKEVINHLKHEVEEAQGTITTHFGEDLTINYIKAYATSVLYNLLSNAVKYRSYERPLKIVVKTEMQDDFLVLSVQDNGIGIDMNRYGHFLFKPFKRLTVDRNGTGIGLSIINNAVKKNGGRIEVESKLDKGALFKVYFKSYAVNA